MFLQEWCGNGRFVGRWKDTRLKGVINDAGHGKHDQQDCLRKILYPNNNNNYNNKIIMILYYNIIIMII